MASNVLPKISLIMAGVFATGIIIFVHHNQKADRMVSYILMKAKFKIID